LAELAKKSFPQLRTQELFWLNKNLGEPQLKQDVAEFGTLQVKQVLAHGTHKFYEISAK